MVLDLLLTNNRKKPKKPDLPFMAKYMKLVFQIMVDNIDVHEYSMLNFKIVMLDHQCIYVVSKFSDFFFQQFIWTYSRITLKMSMYELSESWCLHAGYPHSDWCTDNMSLSLIHVHYLQVLPNHQTRQKSWNSTFLGPRCHLFWLKWGWQSRKQREGATCIRTRQQLCRCTTQAPKCIGSSESCSLYQLQEHWGSICRLYTSTQASLIQS